MSTQGSEDARGARAARLAALAVLGLGLIVAGIAARHSSAWLAVLGIIAGLLCFGQIVRFLEERDDEDRHGAGRAAPPVKQPKLIDEPGLKTVPRQFDALKTPKGK